MKGQHFYRHGYASRLHERTREYRAWTDMRKRCLQPSNKKYHDYGGRGITICRSWDDFPVFLQDMGQCPSQHSLDRVNNDGNYEPANCRWATQAQQVRNTRRNVFVYLDDERMTLTDACRSIGASFDVVRDRLRAGWSLGRALMWPTRPMKTPTSVDVERLFELLSSGMTQCAAARILGVTQSAVSHIVVKKRLEGRFV